MAKKAKQSKLSRLFASKKSRIIVLFVLLFGTLGLYLTFSSSAANNVGLALPGTDSAQDCENAGGTKLKETSGTSGKKDLAVCELTAGKTIAPINFHFNGSMATTQDQYLAIAHEIAGGADQSFKSCYTLRTMNGSAKFYIGGYRIGGAGGGAEPFTQDTGGKYVQVCPGGGPAGNSRVYLQVESGTVRISNATLVEN